MNRSPSDVALAAFKKRLEEDPDVPSSVSEALPTELPSDAQIDLAPVLAALIQLDQDENS
ncbi:hypothetical protein [Sphingomonas sp.]|jgi:hypothetical protein|uniref:hypothetical protein n=1 Tax=Sphingomonas sp. TaxID=28214 RepID=UPI002612A3F5|nr:hypothetical protein [Sphingomonas sp.]MDF2496114.1 hypothetical protein [Sphingomonas sp.]